MKPILYSLYNASLYKNQWELFSLFELSNYEWNDILSLSMH